MGQQEKTFVLGLGHQKCGTTWVHSYLSTSPNFAKGAFKEFHIWDRLDIELLRPNLTKKRPRLFSKDRDAIRYKMQHHPAYYYKYFANLLVEPKHITADITPSYSGLKSKRLAAIKHNFRDKGIRVKAVIHMREPLSRIKSAVRYNLDRGNYNEGISRGQQDFGAALSEYYKTEDCILRTRYGNIISEARNVFSEEDLYIGVYENMFTKEEILRLSDFLGVPANYEHSKVKVNKTRNAIEETHLDATIKEFYGDVYSYCFENFPKTKYLWRD